MAHWRKNGLKVNAFGGIQPKALRISKDVVQLRCKSCGHEISAALEREDGHVAQRPMPALSLRWAPIWKWTRVADYYGKLYATGDIERIFAEEHTGLLERDARGKIGDML